MTNKLVEKENLQQNRSTLKENWGRWTQSIEYKDVKILVSIIELWCGRDDSAFTFRFTDKFKGWYDITIHSPLIRIEKKNINDQIKLVRSKIPIGSCPSCMKKAIIQTHNKKDPKLCGKCLLDYFNKQIKNENNNKKTPSKKDFKKFKSEGYNFVLELWIYPKMGGDKFSIQRPFKKKPTPPLIKSLAKKLNSSVINNYKIIKIT